MKQLCFGQDKDKLLSQGTSFPTRLHVHPGKTKISLMCILAVWSIFAVHLMLWSLGYPQSVLQRGWSDRGTSNEYPKCMFFYEEIKQIIPELSTNVPPIALVKALFSIQKYWYFSYFSTKTYIVGTHNICFRGEIRKIFTRYLDLCSTLTSALINLTNTCCWSIFLAFLSRASWDSVCFNLSLISFNSCSISGACTPPASGTTPCSDGWLLLLLGEYSPWRRWMWDWRKELFRNALEQNGHCERKRKYRIQPLVFFQNYWENEIFKVKLISIKAYSPQDIISLIWAVHREIDLQKKDN